MGHTWKKKLIVIDYADLTFNDSEDLIAAVSCAFGADGIGALAVCRFEKWHGDCMLLRQSKDLVGSRSTEFCR